MLKLAVLWEQWTGYLDASLRALCARHPVRLVRSHMRPEPDTPFRLEDFIAAEHVHVFDERPMETELAGTLARFEPDAILISSWNRPEYRRIARSYAGRATRILGMDNQWKGTLKQRLGCLAAPFFLHPAYDKALVAGPRQRLFARKLGFADAAIFEPMLCCDTATFSKVGSPRFDGTTGNFLYAGRLLELKGFPVIVEAYRNYRSRVRGKPWGLIVAGTGPERSCAEGVEGIDLRGFVQPADLPALFAEASCLVMPSRTEAWGVAIHEAGCVGLPVICSAACGAVGVLVESGASGFVFETQNVAHLTECMTKMSAMPSAEFQAFSERSRALAQTITLDRWADVVWTIARR